MGPPKPASVKGCTLKSAKEEDTLARGQEKPDPSFQLCHPSGVAQTVLILPAVVCDKRAECCQSGKLSEAWSPGIVLKYTETLLSGSIFQGLRGYVPAHGQGPVLSLECAGFGHPTPAEQTL
uniref:Uncharacterized protein n=1 Tax=Parascaris equorum TaxID=6256 RepID=A0A914SJG1_PAREQ